MRSVALLLLLSFFSSGCIIVNMIQIRVFPDARVSVIYTSAGDSADIFNKDFPHPKESDRFIRTVDKKLDSEGEPFWTMVTRGFLDHGSELVFDGNAELLTPMDVQMKTGWLSTRYSFAQAFIGQELSRKYPKFIDAYTEDSLEDSTTWLAEYHLYSIGSALEDLSADMEALQTIGMIERLTNHASNHFNYIIENEKIILRAKPSPTDLKELFSPFLDELPPSFGLSMSLALRPYQDELFKIIDLKGEQFQYSLLMPGRVLSSNADSTGGDTLKWTVLTEDILNDSSLIAAYSIIFNIKNIQISIIAAIAIIIGLLTFGFFYKKRRH